MVSPLLEGFRARGVEVLLLTDPIDSFWVMSGVSYEGKPFKSVTQGAADLSQVPLKEGETAPEAPEAAGEVAALVTRLKEALNEHVEDVRLSTRLRDSAVCLIAPEHGLDLRLAKILAEHGESGALGKPVLEINSRHPAILALAKVGEGEEASDGAFMLLDLARIADGEPPVDAAAFARRLAARLAKIGA